MNKKALFAGGCFWCTEAAFYKEIGIEKLISGYAGGTSTNPTYEQVSSGDTDYYEALLIEYNELADYKNLIEIFWRNIDPFDDNGQLYDRGNQYKTAIFYYDDIQKNIAELSKKKHQRNFGKEIKTEIIKATTFYKAEEYHQDYHNKNPLQYDSYKKNSGRTEKLKKIWISD